MKKGMIIIGAILGLLLLLVLALPYLLDLNRYREHYLPLAEHTLNRKIEIGHIRLMWFPFLGIQVDTVKIYDDPSMTQQPFVEVETIELAVKWIPLLQRRIEVQSLTVHQPVISIIHMKDNTINIATLGNQKITEEVSSSADESLLAMLGVEQLIISDGFISYEDRSQEPTSRYQLEKLKIHTQSVRLGDTAKVSVQAVLTPHQLPLSLEASIGPLSKNFDISQIEARLNIKNSSVEAKGHVVDGALDLTMTSSSISLNDLPLNVPMSKSVALTDVFAHINHVFFEKEDMPFSQRGLTVTPFRFHIVTGKSTLKVAGDAVEGKVEIHGTAPVINSEDMPFSLPLSKPVSVNNLELTAQIEGPRVQVAVLTGEVFDGQLKAKGSWDGTLDVPAFHMTGLLESLNVAAVQRALHPVAMTVTGIGTMNWHIKGTLPVGQPPVLSGRSQLSIVNGEVMGIDLLQRIEQILKLKTPLSPRRGMTGFSKFHGELEFFEDQFPINSVLLEGHNKEFLMKGAGLVKRDQSMMIKGNLWLGDVVSEKIIRQMPVAKVALQEGMLNVPFTVNGRVSEPKISLDVASIQKRVQKQIGQAVQDILKGDPKDVQDLLKKGKSLLKGLFGK